MHKCVLITSHLNSNKKWQKKSQWVFYTQENPKVTRYSHIWRVSPHINKFNKCLKYNYILPDHGYAHLVQIYRGFQLADTLNYDYVIHLNYDIELTDLIWEKIVGATENFENLVRPWGDQCFATDFFCFKTAELIEVFNESISYYENLNPPNIKDDWICETFFNWMINRSGVSYKLLEDSLNVSNIFANDSYFQTKNLKFEIYRYEVENCFILVFDPNYGNDYESLILTDEGGNKYYIEKTNIDNIYTLPMSKARDYFADNQFLFNYDSVQNFFIT